MRNPTPLDFEILRFIERFWDKFDISPTNAEIAENIGKFKNYVFRHLEWLEQLEYVRIQRGKARGIVLLRTADGFSYTKGALDISILGYIAAGAPIPLPNADDRPISSVRVSRSMILAVKDVYALFVRGDSMIDVYINDGDIVFIKYQRTAENGNLVAARLLKDPTNPTTTLKRLHYEGNRILLKPENPNYLPIPILPDELEIQGIVVGVWRNTYLN